MEVCGPLEEEEQWPVTDYSCSLSFCAEPIPYAEMVVVISMYSAGITENGVQYAPLPSDDGDYLYEPCWFCEDCWEHVLEELREFTADIPPVADDQAAFNCQICDSGIRLGEIFGVAVKGQLEVSQRTPEHMATPAFQCMDTSPLILCIACMNKIEKDIAEMWGGRIVQLNECEEGTYLRCWRHGCSADGNCNHIHPMEIGYATEPDRA